MDKCAMALFAMLALSLVGTANADVPGRPMPGGAVPNPGTQQQELFNITWPAAWNVFEFVVTCAACHSGTVDHHASHMGNWAGTSMASAARDPVFRANEMIVNNTVLAVTGQNGAGNVCFRCHSPNGWTSGRFDPALGGSPDGATMLHNIVLSTDDEGVMCETCHRAVGAVAYKRPDILKNASTGVMDAVWNVLAGLFDWPHQGHGAVDQAGDPVTAPGNPYGDTSLQFLDGNLTYVGPYSGNIDVYFSDLPLGGSYTGQIYGVYPDWWVMSGNKMNPVPAGMPAQNSAGQYIAYAVDGTLPPVFDVPVGAPTKGNPVYNMQAMSMEHSTVGDGKRKTSAFDMANPYSPVLPAGPGGGVSGNKFITTSEFCGSCHELTVPVLNHGMPEQRTFTEWKYSDYSKATNVGYDPIKKKAWNGEQRCQDCHMPKLKHEYADFDPTTYNPDPFLTGGFPYGKDRAQNGGIAFHKLTGANRNLPAMMTVLYPEVEMGLTGIATGRDPRVFPGVLSDRTPAWSRAQQNTDITLRDAMEVQVSQAPVEVKDLPGVYEMKVKVINKSGHRIPTGYPDGRRFWLSVAAKDASGVAAYESGVYDPVQATLSTAAGVPFNRALSNVIDATVPANNAVMVYERVTGTCTDANNGVIFPDPTAGVPAACTPSTALTNNFILFDNRIPPKGFTYQDYRTAGVKFWNYNPVTKVPFEQGGPVGSKVVQRYPDGQNWDEVTYRFKAAPGQTLTATAEVYWQTHTREFMENLRDSDTSIVRPQGPVNPAMPTWPIGPAYLSDSINGKLLSAIIDPFKALPLNDNWGGVAYAAWLETGKGAPFLVDRDDTAVGGAPAAPTVTARALNPMDPGYLDPVLLTPDPFGAVIEWTPVANADGYEVWVLYGKPDPANPTQPTATADWDRLAVVGKNVTSHTEYVMSEASINSPGKTYGFKVVAFNGKGNSVDSNVFTHKVAAGLPTAPTNVTASVAAPASTATQITLTWFDTAINEAAFEIWRFPAMVNGNPTGLATIIPAPALGMVSPGVPTQTGGPNGGVPATGLNTYVDADPLLVPNRCYFYQVRALGPQGGYASVFTVPVVQGCTTGTPAAIPKIDLTATAVDGYNVNLNWTTTNGAAVASYKVSRNGTWLTNVTGTSYADAKVVPNGTYTYNVQAVDAANVALVDATVTVTTPAVLAAPINVTATKSTFNNDVTVSWTDKAATENNYAVERAVVEDGIVSPVWMTMTNLNPAIAGINGKGTYVDKTGTLLASFVYRVRATSKTEGTSMYGTSNTVAVGAVAPAGLAVTTAVAPVTGPFVTNGTGGSVTTNLTWFDNAKNEDGYEVQSCIGATYSCGATSTSWKNIDGLAGTTVLPAGTTSAVGHVTPLTTASQLSYRVRAKAGTVVSAWVVSKPVNVAPVPAKPTISSATAATTDVAPGLPRVTVSWYSVAATTSYVVERSGDNGATWSNLSTQTTTSFVDTAATGLTGGKTYQYRVTALNATGWNTSAAKSITLAAVPAAVAITSVTPSGAGALAVKFTTPYSYGSGWILERSPAGANAWTVAGTAATSGAITHTSAGLAANTTYDFRVRMYNAGGYSTWSAVKGGTTLP